MKIKEFTELCMELQESANRCHKDGHAVNGFAMTSPMFFRYHIFEDLKKIGAINEETKFLDLGCGNGSVNAVLSFLGVESHGVDNNQVMVEEAKKILEKVDGASCKLFNEDFNSINVGDYNLLYSYVEFNEAKFLIDLFSAKASSGSRLALYVSSKLDEIEKNAKSAGLSVELKSSNDTGYLFLKK